MKIVINKCYGGFGLSCEAVKMYLKLKGKKCFFYKQTKYNFKDGKNEYIKTNGEGSRFINIITKDLGNTVNKLPNSAVYFSEYSIERTDADLIRVVEKLGKRANGSCSSLRVIEIPDDVKYEIDEYDGIESVHEVHRSW